MKTWLYYILSYLALAACGVYIAKGDSSVVFVRPAAHPNFPPSTGIIVGVNERNEGIVITSDHILELGEADVGDGKTWRKSTIIGRDSVSDLSALLIEWNGPASSLSNTEAAVYQPVWTWGAKSGYWRGRIEPSPRGTVTIKKPSAIGDSGSPLFSQDKKIVGILCGGIGDIDRCGNIITRPIFFGPNVGMIQRNLKFWGWECRDGTCRRIGDARPAWTPIKSSSGAVADRVGDTAAAPTLQQGPPGKSIVGPQGIPGRPGKDAVLDLSKLPPIKIELLGADGKVARTLYVRPGGTLQLPPITFQTIGADGKVFSKTQPLGGTFKLGFFEKEN